MQCDDDWYLVVWNVSRSLDGQEISWGHPVFQFTWHEAFSACPIAGVILRLYHLLSAVPALVLAHDFAFEHRFLGSASWRTLLSEGLYGHTFLRLLGALSSRLCHEGSNPFNCEAPELQYVSLQEQLQVGVHQAAEDAELQSGCTLKDLMACVAMGVYLRSVGSPHWGTWIDKAQAVMRCTTAGLSGLLLTGRKLFQALLQVAARPRPPRRHHHGRAFWERLRSPVERVEGQWCGAWPRASARVADLVTVHGLGASVHVTPAKIRVLEMAVFFERLDAVGADACGSFFGSHWWRLQCTLGGAAPVQASTLSGLAWIQPIKSNLVACVLPEDIRYPAVVFLDMLAEDGSFMEPLRFDLCALTLDHGPSGAAVCTEPLHGLHGHRAVPDLVEHHLRLGYHVDLYDTDGTGARAYERFRGSGGVSYFPRFVNTQFGANMGEQEAAGIHEPAAGCSTGMQEIHCLFRHRGRTRWVAPRLDPDEYFHIPCMGMNSGSVTDILRDLEERIKHVFVPTLEFGGAPAQDSAHHVVERFLLSSGILSPKWMVLSDPADAMSSHSHSVRPRPGIHEREFHHVNGSLLRINHYLEMFGPRFVPFIHASRQQYHVRDRSLLVWLRRQKHRRQSFLSANTG